MSLMIPFFLIWDMWVFLDRFGGVRNNIYLTIVIMWWPLWALAPLVAEKGTQVRILGRTRCCIFPSQCRSPNFYNPVTVDLAVDGKAPRRAMGISQKTCHVIVRDEQNHLLNIFRALGELGHGTHRRFSSYCRCYCRRIHWYIPLSWECGIACKALLLFRCFTSRTSSWPATPTVVHRLIK